MVLIIGISGKKEVGKDTLGNAMIPIAEENGFKVYRRAYGDALKEESADFLVRHSPRQIRTFVRLHAKDKQQAATIIKKLLRGRGLFHRDFDFRGTPVLALIEKMQDAEQKKQFREWMQFYGTEYRRINFGWHYWLDKLNDYIELVKLTHNVVTEKILFLVPDVRFYNEARFIQRELSGYLVRIEGYGFGTGEHSSETDLDTYKFFDAKVLNLTTLQEFKDAAPKVFLQAYAWKAGAANVSQVT